MANKAGTLELLAREVAIALRPLAEQLTPANAEALGLRLPSALASQTQLLQAVSAGTAAAAALSPLLDALADAIAAENPAQIALAGKALLEQVLEVIQAIEEISTRLESSAGALGGITPEERARLTAFAQSLLGKILDYLIVQYIESKSEAAAAILTLIGLIERREQPGVPGDTTQPPFIRKSLHLERVGDLFRNPAQYARTVYDWGGAGFDARLLFQHLQRVIAAFDFPVDEFTLGGQPVLEAYLFSLARNAATNPPSLDFDFRLPATRDFETTFPISGPWSARIKANARFQAGIEGTITPPASFTLRSSAEIAVSVTAGVTGHDPGGPMVLLGEAEASRIEAESISADLGFVAKFDSGSGTARGEPAVAAAVTGGKVVIDLSKSDGFVQTLLSGVRVEGSFDLHGQWRPSTGLEFQGSGGVEIAIPAHLDLGPIKLQTLYLVLGLSSEAPLKLETSCALAANLGALSASIDRIGAEVFISFPEQRNGNLGPVDLAFGFKPPHGVGLAVDAGVIKGGGVLNFNPAKEEYFGGLELVFSDFINLKAVGIINTRMPDGSSGFSLLIIITAEFTPIQLGFGFTLNGVGGLLGLHRTTRVEVLREGIKTNALKSILFPEDIIVNINRIISDIRQVFPPQQGRFLIGPMAKIGWGTPSIITLEMGLLLEIPVPRIIILGVLKALLPAEEAALLRLQVNFLGVIDFENEYLSFDATLYDSRLLVFTLTGDMAFRLSWGDNPLFILSVGGFHPSFREAPGDLQNMTRLTISLLSGENPRITIQSYFAVTSNTVQCGAKAELYAAAAGFNIYGFIGYDVLFQFDPFRFIAGIYAGLALRRGTSVLMGIRVAGELAGPTPWDARGEAGISILFFEISVSFHETWGDRADEIEPEKADIIALLTAEVNDTRNWKADIPNINHIHVSVKHIEQPADKLVIHPFGALTFSERLVPLQVTINKFGNKIPRDADRFELTDIQSNSTALASEGVKEQFARANFIAMKDAEKLSIPSFEPMPSGFKITASAALQIAPPVNKSVDYELTYLRKRRLTLFFAGIYKLAKAFFKSGAKGGAVSKSSLSYQNNRPSRNAPEAIAIAPERYVIANVSDMLAHSSELVAGSYTEAVQLYRALVAQKPELQDQVQILSEYEISTN